MHTLHSTLEAAAAEAGGGTASLLCQQPDDNIINSSWTLCAGRDARLDSHRDADFIAYSYCDISCPKS